MRKTTGYAFTDYKTNTEITKEVNITSFLEKNTGIQKKLVTTYKQNAP